MKKEEVLPHEKRKINADVLISLYANRQSEKTENKQTFNLPDLGLSSALGLFTPESNNNEE